MASCVIKNKLESLVNYQNVCNRKMKKKITTYSILISYLALFLANIFHFHYLTLNSFNLNQVSEQSKRNFSLTHHSAFQCPVHNTFNSLHSSDSGSKEHFENIFIQTEKFSLKKSDYAQSLFFFKTFSLRAPPILHS